MSQRNPHRIYKKISNNADIDAHVHTNWSEDNLKGPNPEDYIPLAEKYKIHISFADHFEIQYYKKYGGAPREDKSWGGGEGKLWRFRPETIDNYLEIMDNLRENHDNVTLGIEIDYYIPRKENLREFIDDYKNEFDLFIGSVHELQDNYHAPVTIINFFNELVEKYGSIHKLVEIYWEHIFEMISDEIFDVVAHPDVIYRFLNRDEILLKSKDDSNTSNEPYSQFLNDLNVLKAGKLCIDHNTLMEVNLSGLLGPWKESYPNKAYVYNLLAQGVNFIVGSDSHNLEHFEKSITNIRKYNYIIKTRTN